MKNFESRTYSISDFLEWDERDQLKLAPQFQRRHVWSSTAKSYLMDTIIRGLPIPKVFIRQQIHPDTNKSIREVVDGQQRLNTILDFIKNGFLISKTHNSKYGGSYYKDLPTQQKEVILRYEIATDLLVNLSNSQILDVFSRLNTYTVVLNNQEKLNAKYLGKFKQLAYKMGYKHLEFYLMNKILRENQIYRMGEAELSSELIIAILENIQAKKSIEHFYKKYDESIPGETILIKNFDKTIDIISETFGENLSNTNFSRIHMFYTIFLVFYDLFFLLPSSTHNKLRLNESILIKIKNILAEIDDLWNVEEIPRRYIKFFEAVRRGTTDQKARQLRHDVIIKLIQSNI